MARLVRTVQRPQLVSSSSSFVKTLVPTLHQQNHYPFPQSQNAAYPFLFQTLSSSQTVEIPRSPFQSKMLRILLDKLDKENEHASLHERVTKFNSFTIQDCPGEPYANLRSKFGETEDITIKASMFDLNLLVRKPGDGYFTYDDCYVKSRLSLVVNISKSDKGDNAMEFVCSAWRDCLKIRKVFMRRRDRLQHIPYVGSAFRKLNNVKLRNALKGFLQERGVNDELSAFMHHYMRNKRRNELIHWLENIVSFVEK